VPPSAATQTLVVRAAERAGEWRAALRLMEDMRKDDVTFYDNPLFDSLFRTGVMVWNAGAGVEVHPDDGAPEGGGD
jgi:pentatricopeptide repeat protein